MTDSEVPFNPFPGLRHFRYGEQYLFFGREGQSREILRRLQTHRFLAVVGTSGSGKSSLIRAGLLPDLYGGFLSAAGSHWRAAIFRPVSDPIGNLARALNTPEVLQTEPPLDGDQARSDLLMELTLRRSGLGLIEAVRLARLPPQENVLVIVDQFEELFRFANAARDAEDAAAFVKLLLEATRQTEVAVYVVITMRSDFIGDCARFRDLPEAVTAGMYLTPRMSRDQRRSAIEEPISVGGGQIALRLVNRLLNEVGDNPDQLPILQHALMRCWDHWSAHPSDGTPIDIADFDAIGGLDHALSKHADEAYDSLPSDTHRTIARKMFQCLTERGEDNRETRRPTTVQRIAAVAGARIEDVIDVVDAFHRQGRSFLTTSGQGTPNPDSVVDISHESLIRLWGRLRTWVEEESESAHLYKRLAEDAAMHAAKRTSLLRDPALQNALDWRDGFRPTPEWAKRYSSNFDQSMAFLDQSRAVRASEEADKERQRTAELRRARRNLAFATVTVLLLLIAVAAAMLARLQSIQEAKIAQDELGVEQRATREAKAKTKEANDNKDRALAAEAHLEQNNKDLREAVEKITMAKNEAQHEAQMRAAEVQKRRRVQDELLHSSVGLMSDLYELPDSTKTTSEVRDLSEATYQRNEKVDDEILNDDPDNKDALLASFKARAQLLMLQDERGKRDEAKKTAADNIKTGLRYMDGSANFYRQMMGAFLVAFALPSISAEEMAGQHLNYAVKSAQVLDRTKSRLATGVADPAYHWRLVSDAYELDGDAQRTSRSLDAAIADYQKALEARQTMSGASLAAPTEFKLKVVSIFEGMASMNEEAGHRAKALANYGDAISYVDELLRKSADNLRLVDSLIGLYTKRGALYIEGAEGHVAEGDRALGERDFAQADAKAGTMPATGADERQARLVAFQIIGDGWRDVAYAEHDRDRKNAYLRDALRAHEEALRLDLDLANNDSSAKRQWSLRWTHQDVGRDHSDLGDYASANPHYIRSLEAAQTAAKLNPGDGSQRAVAEAYRYLSNLGVAENRIPAALDAEDKRIETLERIVQREMADERDKKLTESDQKTLANDKKLLAQAYGSRSWIDVLGARFEAALSDATKGLEYDSTVKWIHGNEAHAYLFMGRTTEAIVIYRDNADTVLADDNKTFLEAVFDDFRELASGKYPGIDVKVVHDMECVLRKQTCAPESAAR